MFTTLLLVAVALLAFIAWKVAFGGERGDASERKAEELGELRRELGETQRERDELSGKNKQLFATLTVLDAEHKALQREGNALKERLTLHEAEGARRTKEHEEKLRQLSEAQRGFEEEKLRVRREDDERRQRELAERDRMWAEHEQAVVTLLTELCKSPELCFTHYTNTSLPEDFDGSLRPDFMIELLGQYIIFDAKVSKAKNLQIYINDTVKKTVQKVKGNDRISKLIFLVVPTETVGELKSHVLFQEGYTLYVVSPEALAPILASLKRIEHYEFAEKIDPEERENIIHLIAKLDTHINFRNTFDVLMAKQGAQVLHEAQRLDPELAGEVAQEKAKIRPPNFKPSDVKKLMNGEARKQEVENLTLPRAAMVED